VTVIVLVPVMLLQLAGTGDLMGVVLGFSNEAFRIGCIVGIGALMISYAAIGGMKGTALVQILKIVMLLGSGAVVAALLLRQFDWNLGRLFSAAAEGSGAGSSFLSPGLQFSSGSHPKLDMISANLTAVIGGACLPHVTMRMYTASSSREVRRSMSWAVSSVTLFVLIITVISFGATALVGPATIMESDAHGGTAYLLGSRAALGSTVSAIEAFLFAMVTTALFLTLLASVAGMTLACANTLAHDLFASGARPKTPRRELTLARLSAVAVGLPTILLAALLRHHNMLPLGMLSASISASALAPAMIYSLFWRRYTRTGLLYTLIGGTLCAIVLTTGTNQVSGFAYSLFPDADFNWFPFTTTGLVSVPVGFALGWLGTMVSERREVEEQRRTYEAVEASILAGAARRGD
jgi:SSS family solute:Na+ symporter/cation/acetate symporter